ncbi:Peptidoglycan-N-acetylmuramic acid deacetylase PdaC [Actinomadura sp. RB68]|uniref:Peptidoglycan-N-acetylmuramic acid deacetylase PdaC n=1 Tax=Actinomadura macrotermitis TaxID=2585200 RepID=A0A7K0C9A2_9ACTN|nr:Peptidoglycan-N-acetylmuramic acid deacetylase PdaC [Actinomadura macrotermitis]
MSRWAAVAAAGSLLAGCAAPAARQVRPVSDASGMRTVDAGAVPGMGTVTRSRADGRRHYFAAYPEIPGARPLSAALARAQDERIAPFVAATEDARPLPGGDVPELNGRWSLVAADGDVAGVRLVTTEFLGASGGEYRRTLWYDGAARRVLGSAALLDGARGLAGLAGLVRARLGTRADPSRITADPRAFGSIAFNDAGGMVVEFSDHTVAPGAPGRVAAVIERGAYDRLLSRFGRRARDAAGHRHPGLRLGAPPAAPHAVAATGTPPPAARTDCTKARCVALTFDDGPGPYTARLLDDLAARRARATFFVVGDNARVYQDLLRRQVAEGHEIGNHAQSHRDLSRLTAVQVNSEVQRTQDVVRTATGRAPVLLRPPYMASSEAVAGVARSLGVRQTGWNLDALDAHDRDPAAIADRVVRRARPDSIVLMHDVNEASARAVPRIVDRLAAAGYTLVTVSELPPGRG